MHWKLRDLMAMDYAASVALSVSLPDGTDISGDFHITEVRDERSRGLDCGRNSFETRFSVIVVQRGNGPDGKRPTVGLLSGILNQSRAHLTLDPDSEIVLEVDGIRAGTLERYAVSDSVLSDDGLTLRASPLGTVCRPALAGACCSTEPARGACCSK
ncbi:MAG: hypothetical protein H7A21_15670 [Spirochaetales bacterium]|nr:hypothetical protein [Leptospiraceae bacterium]MCP5482875.1 hypothetical protein [Spirochaetales bacterium]